jgi:co-chaperonin GroES (HSP10)
MYGPFGVLLVCGKIKAGTHKMNIQPLRNNVVIKADKDDAKTESGILLAREWEKLPHTGEITAVGENLTVLKPGMRVHFNRYAFAKIDKDLFIGLDKNVNAIL